MRRKTDVVRTKFSYPYLPPPLLSEEDRRLRRLERKRMRKLGFPRLYSDLKNLTADQKKDIRKARCKEYYEKNRQRLKDLAKAHYQRKKSEGWFKDPKARIHSNIYLDDVMDKSSLGNDIIEES